MSALGLYTAVLVLRPPIALAALAVLVVAGFVVADDISAEAVSAYRKLVDG